MDPAQRESMVRILLIFFIGLIVLLSIDFRTAPPTFEPIVLLFGILVAGIIWFARRVDQPFRKCPACTRIIPGYSVYCPICGQRLP